MRLGHEHALARGASGIDRWLGPAVGLAAALLAAAWFLPLMTVQQLWIVADEFSIAESVAILLADGEIGLFLVIFIFTMLFPTAKLVLAWAIWYRVDFGQPNANGGDENGGENAAGNRAGNTRGRARARRWLGLVDTFGKWSMLDVFVVALTVTAINISLVSEVTVHLGLYVFIASVVLSMATVARITALAHRRAGG
jgi:paraquat-inducible protein A